MKTYIDLSSLPSAGEINDWLVQLQTLNNLVKTYAISLSMEERSARRKMGPQHFAYAYAAARIGDMHVETMPRNFDPTKFTLLVDTHRELNKLMAHLQHLQESLDDYLMAIGIDAMTYTKTVHDSIRLSNFRNPNLDQALSELDKFNQRVAREEAENTDTPPVSS